MKSKIQINVDGRQSDDLIAWAIELKEGVGEPYRAVIDCASEKVRTPGELADQLLGKRIIVKITERFGDGAVSRSLNGIVSFVSHEGPASLRPDWLAQFGSEKPKGTLYRVVVEPKLSLLRFSRRTEDYPNTTPVAVIKSVLQRNGINPVVDSKYIAEEQYSDKVRFVQMDETDFDFLSRVMARYGLSYSFVHTPDGPEMLYLSDGRDYPSLSALEFVSLPGYSDGPVLAFDCTKHDGATFPMERFSSGRGITAERFSNRFLRPARSAAMQKEVGDAKSALAVFASEAPAGYDENADDGTLDKDFARMMEAGRVAMKIAGQRWHGLTKLLSAMPGRIVSLTGYLDASGDNDSAVKAKIVSATLTAQIGDEAHENFSISFESYDFSDDAEEKRFIPRAEVPRRASEMTRNVFEAVVCDRSGGWDGDTRNTIVVSPRSTPETPWIFLVANPAMDGVMDVAMTMPLGGRRQGFYRFPRVGERILVRNLGDRLVLAGYVPDWTGSFGDFPEDGDNWTRKGEMLRYTSPTGVREANGEYAEVGFSHYDDGAALMEQRILDGSVVSYLTALALEANDIERYNAVLNTVRPLAEEHRRNYFAAPGKETVKELREFAKKVTEMFAKKEPKPVGPQLRLFSDGTTVAYAKDGIEISTPGKLRLNAGEILINGRSAVTSTSEGCVRAASGAGTLTVNNAGVLARARRVIDAPGEYDSEIVIGATDGVCATGANVRLNGLFTASVTDALGGTIMASNGELRGSGAVVDMATAKRETLANSFKQLNKTSGLDKIEEVLSAWKSGKTPDGYPRSIHDLGPGAVALSASSTHAGGIPLGNFRGTMSGVTVSAENLSDTDSWAGQDSAGNAEALRRIPGGKEELTITQAELLRAQAFSGQMKTHAKALETVLNSVVDGKSSSVTIHGHSLDLNVQNLNDLSEHKSSDGAPGGGNA